MCYRRDLRGGDVSGEGRKGEKREKAEKGEKGEKGERGKRKEERGKKKEERKRGERGDLLRRCVFFCLVWVFFQCHQTEKMNFLFVCLK